MEKVVIYGTGSVGRDAYYDMIYDRTYEVAAFTVTRQFLSSDQETLFELPVVAFDEVASLFPPDEYRMLVTMGALNLMKRRAELYQQAKDMGYELVNSISSRAVLWSNLEIGDNCQISANCVVNPEVKIGNNVFIGSGCMIPHEVVLGDHTFLASGVVLSGSVTVNPLCYFGTGSIVRNNVTIASECVIGAGAVILEDTVEKGVYIGEASARLPVDSDKLFG